MKRLTIKNYSSSDIKSIYKKASPEDQSKIIEMIDTLTREQVAPKFEAWRDPARYKIAYGGRGAGSKSWSSVSLLVQKASKQKIEIICLREIMKTLSESSHKLIKNTIERLGYKNWKITDEKIINLKTGSYFIFRGLKDLRASTNVKGMEDFDIAFIDEASSVSYDSWVYLTPTLRKKGSEIWAVFNREEEFDPVYELYCLDPPDSSIILQLEPGPIDNPWWFDTELQKDWDWWKKHDPDEWEHMFLGQPRKQGQNAAIPRTKIRSAMLRNIDNPEGGIQVGCDPADFGDDKTEIYIRKGLKIIDHKTLFKMDGKHIAGEIGAMIKNDPSIPIVIDTTGIGTSTRDHLRYMGLKVIPINFAEKASDRDKYGDIVSEMWFELPIDEIDIPHDQDLMRQLSGRRYEYDKQNRRKIESKKKFKERYGKSPDRADGIILAFYNKRGINMSKDRRSEMRERRNR